MAYTEGETLSRAVRTPRPIEGAIENLDGELSRLESTINTIRDRLDPILGSMGPQNPAKDLSSGTNNLSESLRGRAQRLKKLIDELDDINSRLEL